MRDPMAISWRCEVPELSKLEEQLRRCPKVKELSLNVGAEDDVVTLKHIPHIINRTCPLTEKLRIDFHPNCNLWEFAEHLHGIFSLHKLNTYEFVWHGQSPGILGFMGNYGSSVSVDRINGAVQQLLTWSGLSGESRDRIRVTLAGVNCVCRGDPLAECPSPAACHSLRGFLDMCSYYRIPLEKI